MSQLKVDNITDELGTGAPDFPNGATSGGSDVYAKGNIVGTVSESSGVPTGAIIERGSNANGEFVKYADGTQICTRTVAVGTISDLDSDFNNLPNFSFPANMTEVHSVALSVGVGSDNDRFRGKYTIAGQSSLTTWNRLCLTRHSTATGSQGVLVFLTATGRWF